MQPGEGVDLVVVRAAFDGAIAKANAPALADVAVDLQREDNWISGLERFGLSGNLAPIFIAICLSAILLLVLHGMRERLGKRSLRLLADAVLLTPVLVSPFFPALRGDLF